MFENFLEKNAADELKDACQRFSDKTGMAVESHVVDRENYVTKMVFTTDPRPDRDVMVEELMMNQGDEEKLQGILGRYDIKRKSWEDICEEGKPQPKFTGQCVHGIPIAFPCEKCGRIK